MVDKTFNYGEISRYLKEFAQERDWKKYHTPKNLACALSVEASELLEIFQWVSSKDGEYLSNSCPAQKKKIEDEVSDIATYLIRICDILEIDLEAAMRRKFKENEEKYPADQVKGSARKYNEY